MSMFECYLIYQGKRYKFERPIVMNRTGDNAVFTPSRLIGYAYEQGLITEVSDFEVKEDDG